LVTSCVTAAFYVFEGKRERRQGRRRKKLLNGIKENRGLWKMKEEVVDRSVCRTLFGRGCGLDVRHTTKWLNN